MTMDTKSTKIEDELSKALAERDEARRDWCLIVAHEFESISNLLRIAADQWGRDVALALWDNHHLLATVDWMYDEEDRDQFVRDCHNTLCEKYPADSNVET